MPKDIRTLSEQLEKPVLSFKTKEAFFEVFKIKNLFENQYLSKAGREIMLLARKSYEHYGAVSLTDDYDKKSAIYLVRCSYASKKHGDAQIEEWLSARFIPAEGEPHGTFDLLACYAGDVSLIDFIRAELFGGEDDFLKHFLTISKICKISPYFSNKKSYNHLPEKNSFTALGFALMSQAFVNEKKARQFRYITALFRKEIADKSFVFKHNGKHHYLFSQAKEFFNIKSKAIRINREMGAYHSPGYFLEVKELLVTLKELVESGKISRSTLAKFVDLELLEKEANHKPHHFRNLGKLLTASGQIEESELTGEELRKILDGKVSDGPELMMMEINFWKSILNQIIKKVNYEKK